ncbi:hypothetical protein WICMUC_001100 [Wickerhamomyces mucosus]|uniref:3beta-hydroxysteroid 3-dehydrogenase n=1 Tax=Wickerhamomyces mucosus TaxID=1378264 RepID=A0A9P8THS0_9ASCO|nr:hypothetical protein WICMUC_001100 [Wickerhamomyces mucosus]
MTTVDRKIALITGTNRLIDTVASESRLTIIVTSRTLPRVRESIDLIKAYAKTVKRSGIVDFDYLLLDFTDMVSILSGAYELQNKYDKLDYFFANSAQGVAADIDWLGAVKELCTDPVKGVTDPHYKIQKVGVKSKDDMGFVFQCNVFGPYYFIHKIKPLLSKAKGRIIWVSSIMSDSEHLSFDDIQLLKTNSPYEGSKRSIDLLHLATYETLRDESNITQYLIQPGIFTSFSASQLLNVFTYYGMLFLFYMARFLGSPWICIDGRTAANAPIYAAFLANPNFEKQDVKFGSACTNDGQEYIKHQEVDPTGADDLLKYLDDLKNEWDEKLKDQITNSRKP